MDNTTANTAGVCNHFIKWRRKVKSVKRASSMSFSVQAVIINNSLELVDHSREMAAVAG
jgi:hypothetical protein